MRPVNRLILSAAILLAGATAQGQTYGIIPAIEGQYLDNNGNPLAGGFVVTCTAGNSCSYPTPGSPATTWTDSTGSTPNANPVPLDSSGRANIWLNSSLFYKFVL